MSSGSIMIIFTTGFFILLENQIRQGDVVKLGEHAGTVEVITLRYVQLRDYDGNVHYVPNGHISTVIRQPYTTEIVMASLST